MRPATRLLKHVPLIKFVGGPHVFAAHTSSTPQPHPCAPNGVLPSSHSGPKFAHKSGIEPKEGEVFSRAQLSARFRYKAPKEDEIEDVISGGAEVVY